MQKKYIVYKRRICLIKEIKEKKFNDMDYYILLPVDDPSLTIELPVNNPGLREVISKEEVMEIINKIPEIELIQCDEKMFENEYKRLMHSDDLLDLVKVIKTTYLRNKVRLDNNKKVVEKDNNYFEKAEQYLYGEFAIALGKTIDETREFIIKELEAQQTNS